MSVTDQCVFRSVYTEYDTGAVEPNSRQCFRLGVSEHNTRAAAQLRMLFL